MKKQFLKPLLSTLYSLLSKKLPVLALCLSTTCAWAQDEEVYGTGCLEETDIESQPKLAQMMAIDMANLPTSYSLLQYCPKAMSQGLYGTCVGWSSTYAFRTILEAIKNGWTDRERITREAFSPLFTYAQIKLDDDPECREGTHISDALKLMQNVGSLKKTAFDVMCASYVSPEQKAEAQKYRIASNSLVVSPYLDMNTHDKILVVKKAIASDHPVLSSSKVYESYHSKKIITKANSVWNGDASNEVGCHAMCVVGYDDNKYGGAFLIMNSWGDDYGDDGFFWVRYNDFFDKMKSWGYIASLPYTPSPVIKKYVMSGEVKLQLSNGKKLSGRLDKTTAIPHYEIKGEYLSGTRYRIYLTNCEPAFVYVIGFDLEGNTSVLFPQRPDISPSLPYRNYHIAIPDENYFIEMDDIKGVDYICTLYSTMELEIDQICNQIRTSRGDIYTRIKNALGSAMAPASDIDFAKNRLIFQAATNARVTPIIAAIRHI